MHPYVREWSNRLLLVCPRLRLTAKLGAPDLGPQTNGSTLDRFIPAECRYRLVNRRYGGSAGSRKT
jgi:hypothetical protein